MYVSFDAAFAHTSGEYRYAAPETRFPHLETHVSGFGLTAGGAFGVSLGRAVSVAVETSLGLFATEADSIQDFGGISRVRVGPRIEVRCKYPLFARVAAGAEWTNVRESGEDVYQGWFAEDMRGVYGAFTLGGRFGHVGPFARVELTRTTGDHSTFTPVTFALGIDVSWWS